MARSNTSHSAAQPFRLRFGLPVAITQASMEAELIVEGVPPAERFIAVFQRDADALAAKMLKKRARK